MESKTFAQRVILFFFPKKENRYYIYLDINPVIQFVLIEVISKEEFLSHAVTHRMAEKFTKVRALRLLQQLNSPSGNYKMINCKLVHTLYEN